MDSAASRPLDCDARGQSVGIGLFIIALIVGGLLFMLFNKPMQDLRPIADEQTSSQSAATALDYVYLLWANFPLIVLSISAAGLLVWAVYTGRVG